MNEYDQLDQAYYQKFGDWFPNMSFMSDTKEELMAKMKACLDQGIPAKKLYNLSYDETVSY